MRVLLVEDDSATSASIKMMLRKENFICDTTDLGEDGLEIGKLYDYDIIPRFDNRGIAAICARHGCTRLS